MPPKKHVRRRVWWKIDGAIADFRTYNKSDFICFRWEQVEPEKRPGFELFWEEVPCGIYTKKTEIKTLIIRMAYDLSESALIPSELLYDAGLSYLEPKLWVDDFTTLATDSFREAILECVEGINKPRHRRIVLDSDSLGQVSDHSRKATTHATRHTSDWEDRDFGLAGFWPPLGGTTYLKHQVLGVPPQPEDGSNLSEVGLDWEDYSWEARTFKLQEPREQPDDSECFYILEISESRQDLIKKVH